jgi:hypothetical protein
MRRLSATLCQRDAAFAAIVLALGCGGATSTDGSASGGSSGSGTGGASGHGGSNPGGGGSGGSIARGGYESFGGATVTGGAPTTGGVSTTGGAGQCSGNGVAPPPRAFCVNDSACEPMEHCDLNSCVSSSCYCYSGAWVCTSDCRHVCQAGPGGSAGTGGQGGTSGAGGTATGGGTSKTVPLEDSSWQVALTITTEKSTVFTPVSCAGLEFTLHTAPTAKGMDSIMGKDGRIETGRWLVKDSLYVPDAEINLPISGPCNATALALSDFEFHAVDVDGDGVADQLLGSGSGHGEVIGGDTVDSFTAKFALAGKPDVEAPKVTLNDTLQHPLDASRATASEPLAPDAKVELSGDSRIVLTSMGSLPSAPIQFISQVIKPFSGVWSLSVIAKDLASLTATSAGTLKTLADPGSFAEDGFEGSVAAILQNGAKLVSSVGSMAPLEGTRSLFVPPGGVATLHLKRASGTDRLRFDARALMTLSDSEPNELPVMAGVVGGVEHLSPKDVAGNELTATGAQDFGYAGPLQTVEMDLNEAGADVVVRVAPPLSACGGFCPPAQGILIDSVRIE